MKKYIVGLILTSALVLSGCNFGDSIEKQLSETLTQIYNAEQGYRDAQSELKELEKSEQELFMVVMELTQDETEDLASKAAQLETFLDQRILKVEEEETSIHKAKSEVELLSEINGKISEEHKNAIEELKASVNNRYSLHSTIVVEYKKLTELQRTLYKMLTDETTELPGLQNKVEEVNTQNESVRFAINEFNELTKKVNLLKEDLFLSLTKEEN